MSIYEIIHYRPGPVAKWLVMIACWGLVTIIGYLHLLTGPEMEFHSFYLIPVVLATWYANGVAGTLTAFYCVVNWLAMESINDVGRRLYFEDFANESIRMMVFFILIFVLVKLKDTLRRESQLARRDTLTQLANRRAFFEAANAEIYRAKRYGYPLTTVMLDLDNFKFVNDKMGHDEGDRLLCCVADILNSNTRSSDLAGRLGGDEFVILLPETGDSAADAFATKLQKELLADMALHKWPVTFSIGVATYTVPPENVEALLKSADILMYKVKQSGKNRVECETIKA